MTQFWLIRHGELAEDVKGRVYGSLDIGLSDRGRTQMAQVAEYLKAISFSAIYTSPMRRAIESARFLGSDVRIVPEFRELNFGIFEGLAYDDIAARYPDWYAQWMETPTEFQFPDGESFVEMHARVIGAFEPIRREHEGQSVAIVSHAGVNRILLAHAMGMPHHAIFRISQDYSAINLLTYRGDAPCVRLLNG